MVEDQEEQAVNETENKIKFSFLANYRRRPRQLGLETVWFGGGFLMVAVLLSFPPEFIRPYLTDRNWAFAIKHAGLVVVSLGTAWWLPIVFVDGLGLLLFWCCRAHPRFGGFATTLNRQIAHVIGFGIWTTVGLAYFETPRWIALCFAFILLFLPVAASWIGLALIPGVPKHAKTMEIRWERVLFHRRVVFHGATLAGLGIATWLIRPGVGLMPLVISVMLTTVARLWLWYKDFRVGRKGDQPVDAAGWWEAAHDAPPVLLLSSIGVLLLTFPLDDEFQAARAANRCGVAAWRESRPDTVDAVIEEAVDEEWDANLFLVADNQFRALAAKDGTGQSPVIDAIVPVAVRPVELDMLSGVTLDHFGNIYQRLRAANPKQKILWAHLGDFADLGCPEELARMEEMASSFGREQLAAIAPGNHDGFYTGNFAWDADIPFSGECGENDKASRTAPHDEIRKLRAPDDEHVLAQTPPGHSFLTTVVRLAHPRRGQKGLLAVFIDTSDYSWWKRPMAAGLSGAISSAQVRWIRDALENHRGRNWVLVLGHHPAEAIASDQLTELVELVGDELLAFVAAHTHASQFRTARFQIDGAKRDVDEFIVGSTTDPPQEAALLRVRLGRRPVIRFDVIPAVSKTGFSPYGVKTLSASTCTLLLEDLRNECPSLGRGSKKYERCKQEDRAQPYPEERAERQERAVSLLACLDAKPTNCPLNDTDLYAKIAAATKHDSASHTPGRTKEKAVCLSWAASVLQRHKRHGWSYWDALELSHDRLATKGSWRFTTGREDELKRCYYRERFGEPPDERP